MRVNVRASPQIREMFLAPEDKPLQEAYVTATSCGMEIERPSVFWYGFVDVVLAARSFFVAPTSRRQRNCTLLPCGGTGAVEPS